jgi:membrane associated rhomboid family serine protease
MLPISDDNNFRPSVPFVTWGLIAINVAVFLYQLTLGTEQALYGFFQQWAVVPARITSGSGYETLVSSQFLHGGWLHLGSNMLYLFIFGDNVERALGHIKYLAFYLAAGIIAALAQVFVEPGSQIPSLGASGAVAGVLGAYLVLFPRAQVNVLIFIGIFFTITRLAAILVIGFWGVTQLFSGVAQLTSQTAQTGGGGVAYWAHIGGFVAGLLVGFVATQFVKPSYNNPNPGSYYPR